MKKGNITTRYKILNFTLFVIIIVIILLLHSCTNVETINNLIPTGNIDIFDILIDNSCCKETKCDCECVNGKKLTSEPSSKPSKEEEEIVGAYIFDNKHRTYSDTHNLNIFSHPAYKFENIIAPLTTNVYQFVVRNNNEFNIQYNIHMEETNPYNVNMKYRLKLDGTYVAGDDSNWVTYEDLQLDGINLALKSSNVYQLEWKWFESPNDTEVGEIAGNYSLMISFYGEEIE